MLSSVAAILEAKGGGSRVVVTQRWRMRYHVKKYERLFVVPDLLVQEPVPYEEWGFVVGTAMRHMKATLDAESACGGCRQCCKTPHIAEINKPSHLLCPLSGVMVGCTVHKKGKPQSCKAFECLWLVSQRRNDRMPPELRPDRCGVYFSADTSQHAGGTFSSDRIEAHEDHDTGVTNPDAVQRYVNDMEAAGYRVEKIAFYHGENK